MFFDLDIKGNLLPPKTVCLTYDDGPGETEGSGPGPQTRQLGRYLFEQGIAATFFVVGRHVEAHPGLLPQLQAWGHLIGNHTYSHPGLVALATAGGNVVGEIARTDELIRDTVLSSSTFLRAPYGNWRQKVSPESDLDRRSSIVAEILNGSGRFPHYVGPINWDVSALDWEFWRRGDSAEQCAWACLQKIERLGQGIILMHDSSEDETVRANHRTEAATRVLVAALKLQGYDFVRLDAIPQVQSAMRVSALVALRSAEGHYLVRLNDHCLGTDNLTQTEPSQEELLGVDNLGQSRIALRTSTGQYLSAEQGGGGRVGAGPVAVGTSEIWQIEKLGASHIALRTARGFYLRQGPAQRLRADAVKPAATETFVLHYRAQL